MIFMTEYMKYVHVIFKVYLHLHLKKGNFKISDYKSIENLLKGLLTLKCLLGDVFHSRISSSYVR